MSATMTISAAVEARLQELARQTRDEAPMSDARIEVMKAALRLTDTRDGNIACGRRLMALWRAQREEQTMQITATVYSADLFNGDTDGVDIAASGERYADLWQEAIETSYPDADVTIEVQHGISGVRPETIVDGTANEDGVRQWVDHIGQQLFDRGEWIVADEPVIDGSGRDVRANA